MFVCVCDSDNYKLYKQVLYEGGRDTISTRKQQSIWTLNNMPRLPWQFYSREDSVTLLYKKKSHQHTPSQRLHQTHQRTVSWTCSNVGQLRSGAEWVRASKTMFNYFFNGFARILVKTHL
jgi:hypothetical protein